MIFFVHFEFALSENLSLLTQLRMPRNYAFVFILLDQFLIGFLLAHNFVDFKQIKSIFLHTMFGKKSCYCERLLNTNMNFYFDWWKINYFCNYVENINKSVLCKICILDQSYEIEPTFFLCWIETLFYFHDDLFLLQISKRSAINVEKKETKNHTIT